MEGTPVPSGFSPHFFGGFALTHLRLTDKGNVRSSSLGGPERFGRALTFPLGKNALLGNHLTTRRPPKSLRERPSARRDHREGEAGPLLSRTFPPFPPPRPLRGQAGRRLSRLRPSLKKVLLGAGTNFFSFESVKYR